MIFRLVKARHLTAVNYYWISVLTENKIIVDPPIDPIHGTKISTDQIVWAFNTGFAPKARFLT